MLCCCLLLLGFGDFSFFLFSFFAQLLSGLLFITASDKEKLEKFLQTNRSVKYIRLQWIDYSGVLRARFIPINRCLRIASGTETPQFAQSGMLIPISTAPRSFSLSDYHEQWLLQPDWSSLRHCGYKVSNATVMSFVDQKDAATRFDKCPRTLLLEALDQIERERGAKVLIGFEIDFVLLDDANNLFKPMDKLNGYCRTAGLRTETLDLVEEIVDMLEQCSIQVHHFHTEAGEQLEIALSPEPALQAIDSLVFVQEAIRTICLRRNLKASMIPKPTLNGPSTGLHLHLSLNKLESAAVDNFLAGILSHMGSLCAFGMANYDSYARSVSDAAGAWVGFGTDNCDLPVRQIREQHWEFRMMDGTANPYLFAAAVLLAALDGIRAGTELVWKDCKYFPDSMNQERRAEFGITQRMPATFKEALDCLKEDEC